MSSRQVFMGLAWLIGLVLIGGCGNPTPPAGGGGGGGGAGGGNAQTNTPMENLSLPEKVGRKIDEATYKHEMKQLALFYNMYYDDHGRKPPKTDKEFHAYVQKSSGQLAKWLKEGYYYVIPNRKPDSNTIIVYQLKDLRGGTRWFVRGDGSADELPEAEFWTKIKEQMKN